MKVCHRFKYTLALVPAVIDGIVQCTVTIPVCNISRLFLKFLPWNFIGGILTGDILTRHRQDYIRSSGVCTYRLTNFPKVTCSHFISSISCILVVCALPTTLWIALYINIDVNTIYNTLYSYTCRYLYLYFTILL